MTLMDWLGKMTSKMSKIVLSLSVFTASMAFAHQTVSVSNYPLSLLSNAVTQGTPDAQVLLAQGDVGHHGELSPSGVKLINDSRFVVWFGEELEQNLVNHLKNAPHAISLYRLNAFERLPLRQVNGQAQASGFDPHIWLDPNNAKAIVRALAVIHSHANPEYKDTYLKNAQEFAKRLDQSALSVQNATVKPYWAYHDSFGYLEKSAKLSFTGALTLDHHLSPKITQIRLLSENRPLKTMCLASQSEMAQGIISKLGDTRVVVEQEDLSGYTDFVQAWQQLTSHIRACVEG